MRYRRIHQAGWNPARDVERVFLFACGWWIIMVAKNMQEEGDTGSKKIERIFILSLIA